MGYLCSPVVKTLHSQGSGMDSVPGRGTKILSATWCQPEKQKGGGYRAWYKVYCISLFSTQRAYCFIYGYVTLLLVITKQYSFYNKRPKSVQTFNMIKNKILWELIFKCLILEIILVVVLAVAKSLFSQLPSLQLLIDTQ